MGEFMPFQPFTYSDVQMIFRLSEGQAPSQGAGGVGHAGERHVSIANAGLAERLRDHQGGGLAGYTAFLSFDDQVKAALAVLNDKANDALLEEFRVETRPGQRFEKLKNHFLPVPVRMRYAIGDSAKVFPCQYFTMVLRKDMARPRQMHIVTFYGTMGVMG
jgi:hypothetical protein